MIPLSSEILQRTLWLMGKYADVPMDLADATLVALAEQRDSSNILTLDRRGFETYRINGKKPFALYP